MSNNLDRLRALTNEAFYGHDGNDLINTDTNEFFGDVSKLAMLREELEVMLGIREEVVATEVTELEMDFLEMIKNCDHTSDGHGICGWIWHQKIDMKKYRGVISSLIKKGIIGIDTDPDVSGATWYYVCGSFQKKNPEVEWGGYELTNIVVKK